MLQKICLTSIFVSFVSFIFAQQQVKGSIEDASSKEKLAFAHITINNTKTKGGISDIDGNFNLQFKDSIFKIEVSYLGFKTQEIEGPFPEFLSIQLEPSSENLAEVIISNKEIENPALAIIRQVIANKDKNNPEKIGGFTYTSYSKSVFNDENIQLKRDSIRQDYYEKIASESDFEDTLTSIERALKNGEMYIFMMESVSERKFLPPNRSFEEIIATKVSGFKNPYFAVLATEIQPFGFYREHITLLDLHFLNPIANGSINRYDYVLEDSLEDGEETIHIISFQPKKGRNFDGLKGFMHVHTSTYALQNMVAEPVDEMMIYLKVQQKYTQLNNQVWFPSQLNFEMRVNSGIGVEGKTYIDNVEFLDDLKPRDFSEVKLAYAKDAPKKDEIFWSKYRKNPLSKFEENTYFLIDSIGEEYNFDRILSFGTKLSTGMIPLGKVDFPINRLMNYNRFEGFRLGGGLYTNEKIHEKLRLGGYFAYGFRDSQWKYGGDFRWEINRNKDMYFSLFYSHDVREIGTHGMKRKSGFGFDLREFIASDMDFVTQYRASFKARTFKFLTHETSFIREEILPQYNYAFLQGENGITNYTNTQLRVQLRYAYGEQIMDNFTQRISLGTTYPIFQLDYSRGLDGVLDGDFSYTKVEASLTQRFFTKQVGKTRYRLQGGYIDQNLPVGLLFTGEGSYDQDIPVVMYDTFQTMFPYEFVSDEYVHLFLTHDIGGLLFKSNNFQPGVILHQNMGWGDLRNNFSHSIPFRTKDKIFMESGIEFTKLLKMNYLDTYYLGFGVGAFYRYGEYALNRSKDNFVTKINVSISFN
jgi:hypothetical protein